MLLFFVLFVFCIYCVQSWDYEYSMHTLNILSPNVNGLNSAVKRTRVLEYLHRKSISCALIQETHLKQSDVARFQNKYYKLIAFSCAQNKTKGVLILVNRKLNLTVEHIGSDEKGRFVFIRCKIYNNRLALVSIYGPNETDSAFLTQISKTLLEEIDCPLVVGGDFNAVINPALDKSQSDTTANPSSKLLNKFITELNLIDLWIIQNTKAKDFTFFSNRHKTFSRIDYIFLSPSLISSNSSISILPILLSDHSAMLCSVPLSDVKAKSPRWRFNISLLSNQTFITSLKEYVKDFLEINMPSDVDPQILWETTKCAIRGFCISFSSTLAKARTHQFTQLENKIQSLQNLQKQHFTEQQATQLSSLKEEYDLLSHSKAEFILHRTRQKYYFESERPSHLLALRLKECESKAYISAIKSSDDQVTTNPVAINDIFKGFYTNLYKAETDFDEPICKQYLDKLELPRISQIDKESLEAPLSLEELHVSLKSLQKGKSPGLDGLPPELYLEIWDLVGILMLNSFNFAIEHGAFHRDQKTSLISLLLKKGKDPLDCSSYRPISLIPCDLKIYAKVFASRLEKVIHSLIKEDQTGFIKGRNASDNMRRLLHILDFADSHPTPCAVFSLDAEKAFDRLEWNYMWAVLQGFGFGEHFVSMIKTLYHSPAASVITGNIISPSFPLQRGTRQGCPLSPLLFCLSLEPLAQAIRKSEVSIKIHDHNHCISLYADDIILYLDHFDVSVSSVIKEFDNFSGLSGYKINWSKSALMPINNVKVNFSIPSFIPIKESFIYLGITIYKDIHKIARDNFNNIFVKVKNDIQRWKNLKFSLQGRISTVKMNLLPRFNFFFSMLPLSPPPGYFKEINSIISKFIWNDKCPRIKLTTLQHPNSAGGLAVPNFELYYWSFQLKALHNWVDPQSTVSWRVIEADKVKPNRLQDILFTGTGKKGDNYKFGPVVANSIKIWKTVERRIGGPFKFCNSTPLWHNLNFVCGNRPFVQPSWSSLGVNTCGDMYDNQGLCSFQALRAKFCLPASAYFVFLQLRSALKAYGVPWSSSISSHPMRDWIAPSAGRPSVSLIYNKFLIVLQNLFLLKLFGIGNYLILIYLSTGRECGLISS